MIIAKDKGFNCCGFSLVVEQGEAMKTTVSTVKLQNPNCKLRHSERRSGILKYDTVSSMAAPCSTKSARFLFQLLYTMTPRE
ncbi:hypothetical protein Pint_03330 [Pistacia integerrima]|uniref:Uncharacterized protein n=1 Tax=Pistacia integerrima TaxID=434235 RepID=A0ACC0ZQV9_9ROSI|nr:hypothetical protein Pint_03330 [Pistacia integerrima]